MNNYEKPHENKKLPLFKYAYLGKPEDVLGKLKILAMDEKWDYCNTINEKPLPILFNYLHHTFSRIKEQNKIIKANNYTVFIKVAFLLVFA